MPNQASELFFCCAVLVVPCGVQAVGFGSFSPNTVLGQPLSVTVPLILESGERLSAECVTAEVVSGESRLPADQVRVQVQPGAAPSEWLARITTTVTIDEPVVEVAVSAGCERRFMRRFTAFADPPGVASALFAGAMTAMPGAASAARPPLSPPAATANAPRDLRGTPGANNAGPRATPRQSAEPAPRPGPVRRSAPAVAAAGAGVAAGATALSGRVNGATRETEVSRLLLDVGTGGGPRLRMDMEEPLLSTPPSAVARASEAGVAPAPADVAETERLAMLEKTLADLKKQGQLSQQDTAGMRARLAEAESRNRLLPWIFGLLLFALVLAVWLALRVRRQARELEAAPAQWWASGAAPLDERPVGPVPEPAASVAGELVDEPPAPMPPAAPPPPRLGAVSAPATWASDLPAESPHEKTAAYGGPFGLESASPSALDAAALDPAREVSVEELLDLEQQADFFIALGQEDAAVDLLMSHLRSTGGLSPLPYTKLLEIYKRQGDRGAYERIRARFNRRFNAYAPHWDVGPLQGRALEEYPEVVDYLQSIWSSPIDAMAVLEAMLFRKDESQELFDLPAYKDVLLLYSLARDLWQQGGATPTDEVDVLLPLGEVNIPAVMDAPRAPAADPGPSFHEYDLTAFELEPRKSVRAELGPEDDTPPPPGAPRPH